ncbi:MAG: MBL fold metallo-hydrolase [Gammaproteobacteria bacterium]|nr:MBL fold metallo-hydrolase [Gammaproteobacteria bacterium]MBU0850588.1 MBL fold metallo-hydrolase [Gammaproteobacteria bacterium]MBU1268382.1 MBL fold metallo-hydrolase [Gammaproteobacteria bacterium]MBU1530226.1 MBL fold metallo-hydrolase [Gammaproteobacteria bacterium]MBU1780600.1 MBL fold metallo-hydrolase [Gammaproteobacteria bacterium]
MLKKILMCALLFIGLGAAIAYTQRSNIALALVNNIVTQRMQNPLDELQDGLHVGLCGTGSPFPDPQRSAPCTLVIAGKDMFLFDAGSAAAKQISSMRFSTGQLKGVFITHFHSDHIDGLGEVLMTRWAQHTEGQRLTVHGPTGIGNVLSGFEQAYTADTGYRTAHHNEATMPPGLAGADVNEFTVQKGQYTTVLQKPDLLIESFAVNHQPINPAVGYRIQYKGRTVVLSGDTTSDEQVKDASQNADLLVHEALSPELVRRLQEVALNNQRTKLAKIFADIPNYHATPMDVAVLAKQAGVGHVVLSHIVPPLPLHPLREIFLGKAPDLFEGPFRIGEDGDFISLPSGSKEVVYSRR